MDLLNLGEFELRELGRLNVILGKNGCGKSYLLKEVDKAVKNNNPNIGLVRYISPERAGMLRYEAGIDKTINDNPSWLEDQRRRNQAPNFKEQSATLYHRLEMLVLKQIEQNRELPGFDSLVEQINTLLDRIDIKRSNMGFDIFLRETGGPTTPQEISSGEAELIALGIELLAFKKSCDVNKCNILLMDEPDVHLHPDLQYRLAKFITTIFDNDNMLLVLATHSTAILGALADNDKTRFALMREGDKKLTFRQITEVYKAILPVFGAHPLSNVFNQSPILLVEGEDDERIWQQAVRSSEGKIRVFPCPVDSVENLNAYEIETNGIIASVYDNAVGYSLRDRDAGPENIDDLDHVVRMRLHCRTAENLLLSDDVLALAGTNWKTLRRLIEEWVKVNTKHVYFAPMESFAANNFEREAADLKEIRNILVGLFSNKPWEVLVGHAIAKITKDGGSQGKDSLRTYLGEKLCEKLLHLPEAKKCFLMNVF